VFIRKANREEFQSVWDVEAKAFGSEMEAQLVKNLLSDPNAQPSISLLAFEKEKAVGHLLLTKAEIKGHENETKCMLLAPMGVVPEHQKQGIGTALVHKALETAAQAWVELVFVLGWPDYYPKMGFQNDALALGYQAPYPIPEKNRNAWMVRELKPGIVGRISGKVVVAASFMKPEYWKE
jgi:putative acetyltransferase